MVCGTDTLSACLGGSPLAVSYPTTSCGASTTGAVLWRFMPDARAHRRGRQRSTPLKAEAELDCLSWPHHMHPGVHVIQRKRCALFFLSVALFFLSVRTPGAGV